MKRKKTRYLRFGMVPRVRDFGLLEYVLYDYALLSTPTPKIFFTYKHCPGSFVFPTYFYAYALPELKHYPRNVQHANVRF